MSLGSEVWCTVERGAVHKKRPKVPESAVGLMSVVRIHKRRMKVVLEMEVSPREHGAGAKEEFKGGGGKQSEPGDGGANVF